MPASIDRIALYITAGFVVVMVVSGFAALVSDKARGVIVKKLGGYLYRAATEESRVADRTATEKPETSTEVRAALQELGKALFSPGYTSQINAAAARLRVFCPDTRQALDMLLDAIYRSDRAPLDLQRLLDAVRDSAADCLCVWRDSAGGARLQV